MKEALRPGKEGTPHLSVLLGVPGCGKSTLLREILRDTYSGLFEITTGKNPSVLITSTTNFQCKNLYKLVLALHQKTDSNVPKPVWVVSQNYMEMADATGDEFVKKPATVHAHWPRKG